MKVDSELLGRPVIVDAHVNVFHGGGDGQAESPPARWRDVDRHESRAGFPRGCDLERMGRPHRMRQPERRLELGGQFPELPHQINVEDTADNLRHGEAQNAHGGTRGGLAVAAGGVELRQGRAGRAIQHVSEQRELHGIIEGVHPGCCSHGLVGRNAARQGVLMAQRSDGEQVCVPGAHVLVHGDVGKGLDVHRGTHRQLPCHKLGGFDRHGLGSVPAENGEARDHAQVEINQRHPRRADAEVPVPNRNHFGLEWTGVDEDVVWVHVHVLEAAEPLLRDVQQVDQAQEEGLALGARPSHQVKGGEWLAGRQFGNREETASAGGEGFQRRDSSCPRLRIEETPLKHDGKAGVAAHCHADVHFSQLSVFQLT